MRNPYLESLHETLGELYFCEKRLEEAQARLLKLKDLDAPEVIIKAEITRLAKYQAEAAELTAMVKDYVAVVKFE